MSGVRTGSLFLAIVVAIGAAAPADAGGLLSRLCKKRRCQPAPQCVPQPTACAATPSCCPTAMQLPCAGGEVGIPPIDWPRCMNYEPLPVGSPVAACQVRLAFEKGCCARTHAGDPRVRDLCFRAAEARHARCLGVGIGVCPIPGHDYQCNCDETNHYACEGAPTSDAYYDCYYNCVNYCAYR